MAGEHISGQAAWDYFAAEKAALLSDPSAYRLPDWWPNAAHWGTTKPTVNMRSGVRYVDFAAVTNGDGLSTGTPWTRAQFNTWRAAGVGTADKRVVFRGPCRGTTTIAALPSQTFDFRGWGGVGATLSAGLSYDSSMIGGVVKAYPGALSNTYYIDDTETGTSREISWKDCAVLVAVKQAVAHGGEYWHYRGLTRLHCNAAAYAQITDVEDGGAGGTSGNGDITLKTPWAQSVGTCIGVLTVVPGEDFDETLVPGDSYADPPTPGFGSGTPIYVVYAGAISSTGVQIVRLSATPGGAVLKFTTAQRLTLLPDGVVLLKNLRIFSTYQTADNTGIPTDPLNLAVGEFVYQPGLRRTVFRMAGPFVAGDEVVVNHNKLSSIVQSKVADVQTIGGTFLGVYRAIDFDGAADCIAWAPHCVAGLAGVVPRRTALRCGQVFMSGNGVKYAGRAENANTTPEIFHCDDIFHMGMFMEDNMTESYQNGDRKFAMVNPLGVRSLFGPAVLKRCGLASSHGAVLPKSAVITPYTTWGWVLTDGGIDSRTRNIYFWDSYGPMTKANGGTELPNQLLQGWNVAGCVFDCRGGATPEYVNWAATTAFFLNGDAGLSDGDIEDNLYLLGQIPQVDQALTVTRNDSAGVLNVFSAANRKVSLNVRGGFVYSNAVNNGTRSTLFLFQDTAATDHPMDATANIQVSVDNMKYCAPGVQYLAVFTDKGAGANWSYNGLGECNIRRTVAMPTTPGSPPTWQCGRHINDRNSRVLTEAEAAVELLYYDSMGRYISPATGAAATIATMTPQDIIDAVRVTTHDEDATRFSNAELVQNINRALLLIALAKPEASSATIAFSCAAGSKQVLLATQLRLLDVVRNTRTKRAIALTDRDTLDAHDPGWHNAPAAASITDYVFDPREPRTFYVYPPASAGHEVDLVAAVAPIPASADALTTVLPLDDTYLDPIVSIVLFLCYSKDADDTQNLSLATMYRQAAENIIGIKLVAEKRTSPDANSTNGKPEKSGL